jgi:hypothetical protein
LVVHSVLSLQDWAASKRERFKEELITLTYATHPRLLRFLGAYYDDTKIYIGTRRREEECL